MHRPQSFLAVLVSAVLVISGCAATGTASPAGPTAVMTSASPTVSSADPTVPTAVFSTAVTPSPAPVPTTDPVSVSTPDPTIHRTTGTPDRSSEPTPAPNPMVSDVSDAGGPVPPCGYEQPAITPGAPDSTPAPDTCQFTGSSPACTDAITTIVDGDDRREIPPTAYPYEKIVSGFARWGGRLGAAMCFAELSDRSVTMTNGDEGIRVLHTANSIVFVERTELARSAGLRGVVAADVTSVIVRDPARPQGVAALLIPVNAGNGTSRLPAGAKPAQILLAPVSSGPATVTAYDGSGAELGSVTVP